MLSSHVLTYVTANTRTVDAFPLDKGRLRAIGAIILGPTSVDINGSLVLVYACPEGGQLDLAIPLCSGPISLYNGPSWFGDLPLQPAGQITMQAWASQACQFRISLITEQP